MGSSQSLPLLMKSVESTPYGLADYDDDDEKKATFCQKLFRMPEDASTCDKIMFVIGWPLDLALYLTMPCWKKYSSVRNAITFFVCLVWIGATSYVISWMITIMGFHLGIPDSLMGLTFLAIGMSIPESLTSVIVARQGHGSMALGNVLGSSIFDVLICLGLPWLIKATLFSDDGIVEINSKGLSLSTGLLLAFLAIFYISLAINRFHLTFKVSLICLFLYAVFAVISTLAELNVFFLGNLPSCSLLP